jgi:hypothetical protein
MWKFGVSNLTRTCDGVAAVADSVSSAVIALDILDGKGRREGE